MDTEAKPLQRQKGGQLMIVLVLIAGALQIAAGAKRGTVQWPSVAILMTLWCLTTNMVAADAITKRIATAAGLVFALAAIYGNLHGLLR